MENGSKPATQADVLRLDQKIDSAASRLDKKIEHVAVELFKRLDAAASKKDIASINQQLDKMTGILDTIAGEGKDNRRTLLVYDKILGKNRKTLEDHEDRIKALEAKP